MATIEFFNATKTFGLMHRGDLIQAYSRHRDAVRGAARRGLTVA